MTSAPAKHKEESTTAPSAREHRVSRVKDYQRRWLVAGVITAIFTALQVQQSLRHGTLALPTTYDDVSYFADGAIFLHAFHQGGFRGLLQKAAAHLPSSPFSTAAAFLAFTVLGVRAWAGPIVNALVLFFFVRAFLGVARSLPLGRATILAVALLGAPFFGLALMQFRPDMICGLLIAAGTLFILLRKGWVDERRDQILAGLLLGAALWAKPHIFPLTLGLFGMAMLLASIAPLAKPDLAHPLNAIAVSIGVGVLVALPYYAVALTETINYIWEVAFGSQASIWVAVMPLKEHLLFYLTMPYGKQTLGGWLYIGPALGIAALYIAFLSWKRRLMTQTALVAALVVGAYLAVTVPEFKGPHGYPFAAIFLAASGLAAIAVARGLTPVLSWIFCGAVLFGSLWHFSWQFQASHGDGFVDARYANSRWAILDAVVKFIGYGADGLMVYQGVPSNYLNEATIRFEYQKRGEVPPKFAVALTDDLETHKRLIGASDIAFVPTPDFLDAIPNLPAAKPEFRAKVIETINASGKFGAPSMIVDEHGGGGVLIYRKLPEAGKSG